MSLPEQFHGFAKQPAPNSLGTKCGIDVHFGDLRLEARARIEEDAPAEPNDTPSGPRREDDVLAGEALRRSLGNVVLDLIASERRVVVVALLIQHQVAQQRPNQVMVRRVENGDRDVGRAGFVYDLPPDGTPSSTLRSACAAPSSPAVSTGTISLAFSLAANFDSVSSCRIETRVGFGFASVIAL